MIYQNSDIFFNYLNTTEYDFVTFDDLGVK